MITLIPNIHNIPLLPNDTLISVSVPNSTPPNNQGIVGILNKPPSTTSEPGKLALIIHGRGGHKNYIYQRDLARELSSLGFYSFRYDFRDCGDSQHAAAKDGHGRSIEQDLEDIEFVINALTDDKDEKLKVIVGDDNLALELMVGHSRGGMAMFKFMLLHLNNPAYHHVRLVNCSSRFNSRKILDLFTPGSKNMQLTQYRLGTYETVPMSEKEVLNLSVQDLEGLHLLEETIRVLSVYGEKDHIVPRGDETCFGEKLGEVRHELVVLPDADHNFIGCTPIEELNEKEKSAIENLGLSLKRGKVNYNGVVVKVIVAWLRKLGY